MVGRHFPCSNWRDPGDRYGATDVGSLAACLELYGTLRSGRPLSDLLPDDIHDQDIPNKLTQRIPGRLTQRPAQQGHVS